MALIVFGVLSDKLRVRKPLMLVGAIGAIVMLILFLHQTDHPTTSFSTLITLEVLLAASLSLAYAPWMAGYTEMVEAKNPALVGTGLALWAWILRLIVGISFIFLPLVINSVNPVVDNLVYAQTPPNGTAPFNVQAFQLAHPKVVAFAEANASWLEVLTEPKNMPIVTAANKHLTAANLGRAPEGRRSHQSSRKDIVPNQAFLSTRSSPYQTQLIYLSGTPERVELVTQRCGQVAPPVAAMVLGLRGRNGPLHPDHLLEPRALEPETGPRRREAAQRRGGRGAPRAGRVERLIGAARAA